MIFSIGETWGGGIENIFGGGLETNGGREGGLIGLTGFNCWMGLWQSLKNKLFISGKWIIGSPPPSDEIESDLNHAFEHDEFSVIEATVVLEVGGGFVWCPKA